MEEFAFDADVWLHDADPPWHFITVPGDVSDLIEAATADTRTGFGAVPVRVTIGSTTWSTSVFPDKERQAYLLPVKKDVRQREELAAGSRVSVVLALTSKA